MKTYSKFLALFLAILMTVTTGTFMVSAAEGVTVTAGGVTLSDSAVSNISLDQKSIDVAFSEAVDESSLASNVSVLTDAATEKVLRMTGELDSVKPYSDRMNFSLPSIITEGTVKVSYKTKISADTVRMPRIQFYSETTVAGNPLAQAGYIQGKYWGNNSPSVSATYDDFSGQWITVEFVATVGEGTADNTYTTTYTKEDGTNVTGHSHIRTAGSQVGSVSYYIQENAGKADISMKDFVVTTIVGGVTNTYTMNLNNATNGTFPIGDFTEAADGGVTFAVADMIVGNEVTMSRSLSGDGKTYTLTNAGDWDPAKTYSLVVNGTKYDFKAKDLSGSIAAFAGDVNFSEDGTATIDENQKDITVAFSEAAQEASLASNVIIMSDRQVGKALHLVKDTTGTEYGSNFGLTLTQVNQIAGGKITIKCAVNYDEINRFPIIYVKGYNSSNELKDICSVGVRGAQFWENTTWTGSISNTTGRWTEILCVLDLDAQTFDFRVDGVATRDASVNFRNAVAGFSYITFGGKDHGAALLDILFKDVEVYHEKNGVKTDLIAKSVIENATVGTQPAGLTYGGTVTSGAASCIVAEAVSGNPVTVNRVLSADGKTYTLTNTGDWDPAKTYTLTVGAGVKKADGITAMSSADKNYNFIARELSGDVTVTAGNVTLSDVDANEIDLTEKTIDVAFSQAVQESTLAENVNLYTDVKTEKVLRITGTAESSQYADNIGFTLPSTVASGTVTIEYKTKISADTVRMPRIQFYGTAGLLAQAGYIDGKYWGNNSVSGVTAAYQGLGGQWVTVKTVANVAAGADGNNTYTTTFTKENGDVIAAHTHIKNAGSDITGLHWYIQENIGKVDISMKDFVVTTVVNGNTSTYTMNLANATVGSSFPIGSFTEQANGPVSFVVAEETSKTPVAVTRSLSGDGKTYSLTNDLGWNTGKNYLLELGTGILTTPGGLAVLDEAKSYSFVARNLGGALTLDAISDTKGNALTEGGYLGASSKGINLTFSDAVNTDTLSGIILQQKKTDRVLNTTLNATGGYDRNMLKFDVSGLSNTTGKYTFTTSVYVDTEDYEGKESNNFINPHIMWTNSANAPIAQVRPTHGYVQSTKWNSSKNNGAGGIDYPDSKTIGLPYATWRDIEYTIDLTNNTHTCKVVGTEDYPAAEQIWANDYAIDPNAVVAYLQFGIYSYGTAGTGDVSWKDMKLVYTADNGATTVLLDIDTDIATMADVNAKLTRTSGQDKGLVQINDAHSLGIKNVAFTTPYNPTTKTVTILPSAALDYLSNYTLTVPTTVMSADGAALYEGAEINFTAIYADGVYSAASGFKAGANSIQTIASDYTGDIKGWVSLTNVSGSAKSAVVIVALYKDGKLVDIDTVPVNNIGAGATIPATEGTVTIDADKAGAGYTAAVYVWESMDTMLPVSLKTTTK